MKLTAREKEVIYELMADRAEENMDKLNAIRESPSKLAVRLAFDLGMAKEIVSYLHPSLTILVKLASEKPPSLEREKALASLKGQLEATENWMKLIQTDKIRSEQDTADCN